MKLATRIGLGFLPTTLIIAVSVIAAAWLTRSIVHQAAANRTQTSVITQRAGQLELEFQRVWQGLTEVSTLREMAYTARHASSGTASAMPAAGPGKTAPHAAQEGMPGMDEGSMAQTAQALAQNADQALQRVARQHAKLMSQTDALLAFLQRHGLTRKRQALAALRSRFQTFYRDAAAMTLRHGTGHVMSPHHMAGFDKRMRALTADLGQFASEQRQDMNRALIDIEASAAVLFDVILIGGLVALALQFLLGATFTNLITRHITRPVRSAIAALTGSSSDVSEMAANLSSGGQQLAEITSQEAAGLEEASSTVEQLASMGGRTLTNTREVRDLTEQASAAVGEGLQATNRLDEAMRELSDTSSRTATILKTIDELAFQTNLLALNAAVEAARAGDSGRGFAVVAEEVRNLASRSAAAARETDTLLEDAQRKVDHGVTASRDVTAVLHDVHEALGQLVSRVNDVTAAHEESAHALNQLEATVAQLSRGTQQSAGQVQEYASIGMALNGQSMHLQEIVTDLGRLVGQARHSAAPPGLITQGPTEEVLSRDDATLAPNLLQVTGAD